VLYSPHTRALGSSSGACALHYPPVDHDRIWSAPRTVDSRWQSPERFDQPKPCPAPAEQPARTRCRGERWLRQDTRPGPFAAAGRWQTVAFSPPESRCPRLATTVSKPSGSLRPDPHCATSGQRSSPAGLPRLRVGQVAAMVSWNVRCASWVTTPTTSCSDSIDTSRRSVPSRRTRPCVGSYSLATGSDSGLAWPLGPTRATSSPGGSRSHVVQNRTAPRGHRGNRLQ